MSVARAACRQPSALTVAADGSGLGAVCYAQVGKETKDVSGLTGTSSIR